MINEPFRLSVNGTYEFEAQPEAAKLLDAIPDGTKAFHVLQGGKAYHAEFIDADYGTRTFTIRIDGNTYAVKISDHYERLVQQLGLSVGGTQKMNSVKAPMPGLVLQILVEPGQTVQKGDPLIILEAMKMENVIKAVGEGQVKAVHVQKGAAVDKGALLIELE